MQLLSAIGTFLAIDPSDKSMKHLPIELTYGHELVELLPEMGPSLSLEMLSNQFIVPSGSLSGYTVMCNGAGISICKDGLFLCTEAGSTDVVYKPYDAQNVGIFTLMSVGESCWQDIYKLKCKTDLFVMPYLEMDIAYACNLHCVGCSHYSNHNLKGWVNFSQGREWIEKWSGRLYPLQFRLLGGEPMLNPELCDYIRLAHQTWPQARRSIVTNGFLLKRQPNLFQTLAETDTWVDVSLHERSEKYIADSNLEQLVVASEKYGFKVSVVWGLPEEFFAFHKGQGATMAPFSEGNPSKSFDAFCRVSPCPILHNGKLYKCAALALLYKMDEKFNLSARQEWVQYLDHDGLQPNATDEQIRNYLYKYHNDCDMCPSTRTSVQPVDLESV